MKRTFRKTRRGFSLTEFAIVLGVGAIIVGGIWAYVGPISERVRINQAFDQVTTTVKNVRSYYLSQIGIPRKGNTFAPPNLTVDLVGSGVIPNEMLRRNEMGCTNPPTIGLKSACVDGPWSVRTAAGTQGGTFRVCWASAQGGCRTAAGAPGEISQLFAVAFSDLTQASCINLALRLSGPDGPPGLVSININGPGVPPGINDSNGPATVAFANARCLAAGGNTVSFVYRLRPPAS